MVPNIDQEYLQGPSKDETDNPRASTASRRTCGSTRASAFFPNASRSPRDLTTLAARVHSPVLDQKSSSASIPEKMQFRDQRHGNFREVMSDGRPIRARWELPSFSFRPLSFGSYVAEIQDRPKTSGEVRSKAPIEILSPMPERPMSSQSRKRFSRILEIEDNYLADRSRIIYPGQTFSTLNVVEEHPGIQYPKTTLSPPSEVESEKENAFQPPWQETPAAGRTSSDVHTRVSQVTIHDKSTVESLLDRHIECLGLNENDEYPFGTDEESVHSETGPESSGNSTVKLSALIKGLPPQPILRPVTSSSTCYHSSLASFERRKLIPRRLFASMDARLPPGAMLGSFNEVSTSNMSSITSTEKQRLSGWQTLPSTSGLTSAQSIAKASFTSGNLADVDSDPPQTKFKVKRRSELTACTETSSVSSEKKLKTAAVPALHRRSKSDMVARQASHQRRRMRILLKAKRKSSSLGQLANIDQGDQVMEDPGPETDWTTEDSPEKVSTTSPVVGSAELSADSVMVQPPTIVSEASVLLPSSYPKRWTSMLAAMPEPVKKGIDIVRKASVRTIHSHRSKTSVTEPLNSTRFFSQLPRVGSVPQLAPPEFGPPLTSSDLNLSLRFPDPPQVFQPPLREVQSFFSDDSSAPKPQSTTRKRFDLHSIRSGLARPSGLLGTRRGPGQRGTGALKLSHSCQMKGRVSFEYSPSQLGETVPMSDFAYKKRKVLDRVRDWWKGQCMQRTLSLMRKKSSRNVQNGALV